MGAAFRIVNITKASIWHDEGFSIFLAVRSPELIWAGSARDVHPPLYYELLHFWTRLFGTSALAIRSLSALAGVALIPVGYLVVKKISTNRAAILASLILACAPFLIRYSQEARMYGLLGLFMLLALYSVACIAQKPKSSWPYILYTLSIAAGLYTHYYAALVVIAMWIYLLVMQKPTHIRFNKSIILSGRWWLANIVALLLFIPWVPNMIAQLRRGQGLGWLPKTSLQTFHDTIWQYLTFTDAHKLIVYLYWLVPILIIALSIYLVFSDKGIHKYSRLLVSYSFVPIIIALAVSLQKPIFHERYFVFVAVGIYLIIAISVDKLAGKRTWLLVLLSALVIGTELIGVRNVYAQSSHKMSQVIKIINNQVQSSDTILAGELYVYFDASYYNSTGKIIGLYTANSNLNGYGESGLLYNQNVYLDSYSKVPPGRVWIIGKTGEHDYYNQIPSNWALLLQSQAGYSEIRLYQVK